GAAKTVTGSMHHVEAAGKRFLLDCGLYQGRRQEAFERNSHFPFPVSTIDGVILSHAHIDHSGNLPTLVHNGYSGPIYTTPATVDLCLPMLTDSAFLQQKDVEFCNRRKEHRRNHAHNGRECMTLYAPEDAEATFPLFQPVQPGSEKEVAPGFRYRTYNAGHMLGSTSMVVEADGVRLAFSGDVGRPGLPIIRDPERSGPADYLIMESTYGDRLHKKLDHVAEHLAEIVNRTAGRGGKIIVPCFAVGRTQQLVLMLHELMDAHRIPSIPIFVDSPLAINVTDVFRKHPECYDGETRKFLQNGEDPFGFYRLRYVRAASDSKALNDLHGPFLVLAASGMCEAGRILHHLRNNIEDPRNTILITGFQAQHTLGRKILDGEPEVPIFGEPMRVRAEVQSLQELSGHADQKELIEWMRPIASGLKKVFLVHGEVAQGAALAKVIQQEYKIEAVQPSRGESFQLS
ncbi:MAG TPA: MBL fold metallo-hydrolase, partial [Bryobacteraceae bacterium]|nr:MBL fold metallo-hydrolase [Bryobacteraceae bacterium]